MLRLNATFLRRDGDALKSEPAGAVVDVVRLHVAGTGPGGMVVLGPFGSGKTHLCGDVAAAASVGTPCTVVPLRDVARHGSSPGDGLERVVGAAKLAEARAGRRVLLLDGIDEVPTPDGGHPRFFADLIAAAGPRWVVTGRPSHFRTDLAEPVSEQIDVLDDAWITLVSIEPLSPETAAAAVAALPSGHRLLDTVDGLLEVATSPLLLDAVRAALPYIEPGRPIVPWGVFDAWIRRSLSTGPRHEEAMAALEELAWNAFIRRGRSMDVPVFDAEEMEDPRLPAVLKRALFVTDLDGRQRFGHRSVYEFLLAVHMAPMIRDNQGHGPDELSGVRITDAIRQFLLTRTGPMPVRFEGDRVLIPRGNFVAGGDLSPDERDLRIEHLPADVWVSRVPATNAEWARFLAAHPDDRIDANYLAHWGGERRMPAGEDEQPVYGIWPEDADRFAAFVGGRVPTADEWEKAVRGLDGKRWPWGDRFSAGRAVTSELGLSRPLPVRALGAEGDAFLFQAVGNVFQYTASAWRGRVDRGRVVMGGCFTHLAPTSRTSLRLSHKLSGNLKAGVRVVWDAP